jgi:peptidoglycan/xylan/chitin deacetylase (PgdA/CDA1 family)
MIDPFFDKSLSVLRNICGIKLMSGYYHVISDTALLHINCLYNYKTTKQFIEDLDFILKYFVPLSLSDLISITHNDAPLPNNSFVLTFDDGFKEMHDIVAPLLIQKGIPAVFFVNPAFIDNFTMSYEHKLSLLLNYIHTNKLSKSAADILTYCDKHNIDLLHLNIPRFVSNNKYFHIVDTAESINGMLFNDYKTQCQPYLTTHQIVHLIHNGFAIGAHSIDHSPYASLTFEEQLYQSIESVKIVREKFNLGYGAFAFPHTDSQISKRLFALLHASGIVDVTFGNMGLKQDAIPNHIQRVSLEKPLVPAARILCRELAKKLCRIVKGADQIVRD